MRRATLPLLLLLLLLLLIGCAGLTTKPDTTPRTPLEIAELNYVQGSMFYEAGMEALQSLRAEHKVSNEQWARIDAAQKTVQKYAAEYSNLLAAWRATGKKPTGFDAAATKVQGAGADIATVLAEVQR